MKGILRAKFKFFSTFSAHFNLGGVVFTLRHESNVHEKIHEV